MDTSKQMNTNSGQKALYRVHNWSAFDQTLGSQDSLTTRILEEAIAKWKADEPIQQDSKK